MARYAFLMVFFLFLLLHFNSVFGKVDSEPKDGFITCRKCKSGKSVNKTIDAKVAEKMHKAVVKSLKTGESFKGDPDFKGQDMAECKSCQVGYTTCEQKKDYIACVKKVARFRVLAKNSTSNGTKEQQKQKSGSKGKGKRSIETIPEIIEVPIGGWKNSSRHLRSVAACRYPSSMETAALTCFVYPSRIKCIERCAFGYTLGTGIRREMTCIFEENKWTPLGFEECKPFLDCTMRLVDGGSATCSSMSVTKGSECKIKCLAEWQRISANPEETHSCDIEGKWNPPLPSCASQESVLQLVEPPEVKLHQD